MTYTLNNPPSGGFICGKHFCDSCGDCMECWGDYCEGGCCCEIDNEEILP